MLSVDSSALMGNGDDDAAEGSIGVVVRNTLLRHVEDVAPPMLRPAAFFTVICYS